MENIVKVIPCIEDANKSSVKIQLNPRLFISELLRQKQIRFFLNPCCVNISVRPYVVVIVFHSY